MEEDHEVHQDSASDEDELDIGPDRKFFTGLDPRLGYGLREEESESSGAEESEADEPDDNDDNEDDISIDMGDADEEDEEEEEQEEDLDFGLGLQDLVDQQRKKRPARTWGQLDLCRPVQRAIDGVGFYSPTEVQSRAAQPIIQGYDVSIRAVTGSGKTAAFLIPMLHKLITEPAPVEAGKNIRALVVEPTRELAYQAGNMAHQLAMYSGVGTTVLVGQVALAEQRRALEEKPQLVVCTPGRMVDMILNHGVSVDDVEILVLDESDKLVLGFEGEVKELMKLLPQSHQTIQLSATMTRDVDALANHALKQPLNIDIGPIALAPTLQQEFVRIPVREVLNKQAYLIALTSSIYTKGVLVFTRNKGDVHRLYTLSKLCGIRCAELQGAMKQEDRMLSLQNFREKKVGVLIASDLASRGLDIQGVRHIINYDMPPTLKTYIHRVGRTARMGSRGTAISFCSDDNPEDIKLLREILRLDRVNNSSRFESASTTTVIDHQKVSTARQRKIPTQMLEEWKKKIAELAPKMLRTLNEEKLQKELEEAEREARRVENKVRYANDIASRPKKTWFESQREKNLGQLRARMKERAAENADQNDKHEQAITSTPTRQGELTEIFRGGTISEKEKRKRNPLDDMDEWDPYNPTKKKKKNGEFGSKKMERLEYKEQQKQKRKAEWQPQKPFEKETKAEKKQKAKVKRLKLKEKRAEKGQTMKRIKTQSGVRMKKRAEEPSGRKLKAEKRAASKSNRFKSKARYKRR